MTAIANFFDKFIGFFEVIIDTVVSLFEGLGTLLQALAAVGSVTGGIGVWMPAGLAAIVTVIFGIALVLRVVGR